MCSFNSHFQVPSPEVIKSRIRITATFNAVHCIEVNPLPGVYLKAWVDTIKQTARIELTVFGFSVAKDFDFNDVEIDIPLGPGGVKLRYKDGKLEFNAYLNVPVYGPIETGWITLYEF